MHRSVLTVAAAMACLLAGSACTGSPEAGEGTTVSGDPGKAPASAPPSDGPASVPPSAPPSPTGPIDDQLETTAKEYYTAVVAMWSTSDIRRLSGVTDPVSCRACDKYDKVLQDSKAKGQRFEGAKPWTVSDFELVKKGAFPEATYTVQLTGGKVVDKAGKTVQVVEPSTEQDRMKFRFDKGKGKWIVLDVVPQ